MHAQINLRVVRIRSALFGFGVALLAFAAAASADEGVPNETPHSLPSARLISVEEVSEPNELPAVESAAATEAAAEPSPKLTPTSTETAVESEIQSTPFEDLAKRVANLEKLIKDSKNTDAASQKPEKEGSDKGGGKWVDLSSEKWNVRMGGHVQLDYINWPRSDPDIIGESDYFEFRRIRLTADGAGYGVFDFRLQMTLEPENATEVTPNVLQPSVKDAYLSMNEIPYVGRFRVGNFFVPFGLEQVTNDTQGVFLERSIPTQGVFTADREVGVAAYNVNDAKNFTWTYGMFIDSVNEGLKLRFDRNLGYRLSGRLTYLPYYDEPSEGRYLVHTGVGVLYTDDGDNQVRFRARPEIHQGPFLIDSGILLSDTNTIGNLELAVVWGRLTVQSEAYLCNVNFLGGESRLLDGAYVHASYFLTGENRQYERFGQHGAQFTRPKIFTNFFLVPGGHGWGAWEFKTRWARLNENSIHRGQYNDLTVGLNWYWSDRMRLMFDWIHPVTSSQAAFGATNSDILGVRVDWNW